MKMTGLTCVMRPQQLLRREREGGTRLTATLSLLSAKGLQLLRD